MIKSIIRPSTSRCNLCGETHHDGLIPVMIPDDQGSYTRHDVCRECKKENGSNRWIVL